MSPTQPDTTSDWLMAVRSASSEEALIAVMRRYVASRAPTELARLPAACRPRDPQTRDDILESAVVLAREELKLPTDVGPDDPLRQMAIVYAEASTRLTRMFDRGAAPEPKPG